MDGQTQNARMSPICFKGYGFGTAVDSGWLPARALYLYESALAGEVTRMLARRVKRNARLKEALV